MARGRQRTPRALDEGTRKQLTGLSQSTTLPRRLVLGAKMILASAEGLSNTKAGRRVGASPQAVGKWRRRFLERGVKGLQDELRPGRPRTYDEERVSRVISRALQDRSRGSTQWSTRTLGQAEGLSRITVSRWLRTFDVKPHLTQAFKLSNAPSLIEKVRDIVGLYLHPPDHAVVLCVDEKSQVRALDRTLKALPMDRGYVEGFTHNYIRRSTTTLFAALHAATGKVIARCVKRPQEYLAFLRLIDKEVPSDLAIHLVVHNDATHKHANVRSWLARRPRFHVHFTPKYASWLNQVARWLGLIGQRRIERGSFINVSDLVRCIHDLTRDYDKEASPFVWIATAQSSLDTIERSSARISTA